ncbi:fimbrial protein [Morganella morganii]
MQCKLTKYFIFSIYIILMNTSYTASANWRFDGTLIIPPICQLGHEDPIRVQFGKIGVRKVDGISFKQKIPYQLDCQGDLGHSWDVKLTFSGILAEFDDKKSTLYTNSPLNNRNLGIQIQKDGEALELNKPFKINTESLPVLEAVPVKREGTELVGDDFSATGTLTITFQ